MKKQTKKTESEGAIFARTEIQRLRTEHGKITLESVQEMRFWSEMVRSIFATVIPIDAKLDALEAGIGTTRIGEIHRELTNVNRKIKALKAYVDSETVGGEEVPS